MCEEACHANAKVRWSPRAGPKQEEAQGWDTEGEGCPNALSPGPLQVAGGLWVTVPSVGLALTEVKGRAWIRRVEPDEGQQDEAGGQKQGQQVEHQQEAKEGEVGLDSSAEEACGRTAGESGRH